jgi:hypothetical protein
MARGDRVEGSSKSLTKTIKEIKKFTRDTAKRPKDMKLREHLHALLAKFGEGWYKRGFRRGHIESYKKFRATDGFPSKLRYEKEKEFFTNQVLRVSIESKTKSR